jgi:hypothetical protein
MLCPEPSGQWHPSGTQSMAEQNPPSLVVQQLGRSSSLRLGRAAGSGGHGMLAQRSQTQIHRSVLSFSGGAVPR